MNVESNPCQRMDLFRPHLIRFPEVNRSNEVAVGAFVAKKLGFTAIVSLVEATLEAAGRRGVTNEPLNVEEALVVDHIARSLAHDLLPEIAAKAF